MKQTIVGKRVANYKDKSGQPVSGIGLYFIGASEGVEGMKTGDVFIKAPGEFYNIAKDLPVGSSVYIFNNSYGRFEGLEVVSTPKQEAQPQEPAKK